MKIISKSVCSWPAFTAKSNMCGQGLEPKLEWNTAALTTPQILNQGENAKNTLAYLHLSLKFNGKKFYKIGHKL
jgi:hypothetical protein